VKCVKRIKKEHFSRDNQRFLMFQKECPNEKCVVRATNVRFNGKKVQE
jgi:hypothetical protein